MTKPMPTDYLGSLGQGMQDLICAISTCIRPSVPPTGVEVRELEPQEFLTSSQNFSLPLLLNLMGKNIGLLILPKVLAKYGPFWELLLWF